MKSCVVISAFGTSSLEGYKAQFEPLIEEIKDKLKIETFIGFTSEVLIKKVNSNLVINLSEKLKNVKEKGFEKIILVKLILSNGKENEKINNIIKDSKKDFKEISVTKPILEYGEQFIDNCLDKETYTLLISHGREDNIQDIINDNFKNMLQKNEKIKYMSLNRKDEALDIIKELKEKGVNQIRFKPILMTKGYHFSKDIYSDDKESFRSIFKRENFIIEEINEGLINNSQFKKFLIEKIKGLM